MNNVRIYAYNRHSEGAKNLSEVLGVPRLRHEGSRWNPYRKTLINWGASSIPSVDLSVLSLILNRPGVVAECSNKLKFFDKISDEYLPEWTVSKQLASQWLTEGHTVVSRKILSGHSGEGIELTSGDPDELPDAPLYTKYFKKQEEYRVHVAFGKVIDVQQKKRKTDVPDSEVNWKVRNLAGGFIYAREGIVPDEKVTGIAIAVAEESGLDFGAYDILWNTSSKKAICLEVNTAPGITGTTVENYKKAFEEKLNA